MLKIVSLSALLLLGCLGSAWADCGDPAATNLATLLGGQLVCASKVSGEQYQEEHIPGGNLIERARGPGDPVDPSYDAGSWAIDTSGANEEVCYTYGDGGSGGTFCFTVHPDPTNSNIISFCEGTGENARGELFPLPATGVDCNPPAITLLPRSLPLVAEGG
jgi:hypothetical protein